MWGMNDVTKIKYKDGYIYHIVFDDGSHGDVLTFWGILAGQ